MVEIAIALGGHQNAPVGVGNSALDKEDVGLLAGLEDTELDVDRGVLGDDPSRNRFGTSRDPGNVVVDHRSPAGRSALASVSVLSTSSSGVRSSKTLARVRVRMTRAAARS
ncbi:MAG: hypothetical protein ACR2F6_09755 [Mycobacteriales bacterium]